MSHLRLLAVSVALPALLSTVAAQRLAPDLDHAVRLARTTEIAPRKDAPAWMDYDRTASGYAFFAAHRATVTQVLMGSSLASTFAARDVTPVLMQTGKLAKSFVPRMMATGFYMNTILTPPASRERFLSGNYARAVSLGSLHREVAAAVAGPLGWDPKVRVAMNGQSYAFVLYSFAWWPVEAMIATKEVDPAKDAKALDDWFHLWSVVGYGMGVPEPLLPRDFAQAREIVARLRKAQYAAPGEAVPEGIATLLGNHVRMLAGMAGGRAKVPVAEALPGAIRSFAEGILLSPGLSEALGLGADPAARLAEYATRPAQASP